MNRCSIFHFQKTYLAIDDVLDAQMKFGISNKVEKSNPNKTNKTYGKGRRKKSLNELSPLQAGTIVFSSMCAPCSLTDFDVIFL
jgi:hypothetical protein